MQIFFTILLVVMFLMVTWFAGFVVIRLFKGQGQVQGEGHGHGGGHGGGQGHGQAR